MQKNLVVARSEKQYAIKSVVVGESNSGIDVGFVRTIHRNLMRLYKVYLFALTRGKRALQDAQDTDAVAVVRIESGNKRPVEQYAIFYALTPEYFARDSREALSLGCDPADFDAWRPQPFTVCAVEDLFTVTEALKTVSCRTTRDFMAAMRVHSRAVVTMETPYSMTLDVKTAADMDSILDFTDDYLLETEEKPSSDAAPEALPTPVSLASALLAQHSHPAPSPAPTGGFSAMGVSEALPFSGVHVTAPPKVSDKPAEEDAQEEIDVTAAFSSTTARTEGPPRPAAKKPAGVPAYTSPFWVGRDPYQELNMPRPSARKATPPEPPKPFRTLNHKKPEPPTPKAEETVPVPQEIAEPVAEPETITYEPAPMSTFGWPVHETFPEPSAEAEPAPASEPEKAAEKKTDSLILPHNVVDAYEPEKPVEEVPRVMAYRFDYFADRSKTTDRGIRFPLFQEKKEEPDAEPVPAPVPFVVETAPTIGDLPPYQKPEPKKKPEVFTFSLPDSDLFTPVEFNVAELLPEEPEPAPAPVEEAPFEVIVLDEEAEKPAEEPAAEDAVAEESAVEESPAEEPVAEEPATEEPAAEETAPAEPEPAEEETVEEEEEPAVEWNVPLFYTAAPQDDALDAELDGLFGELVEETAPKTPERELDAFLEELEAEPLPAPALTKTFDAVLGELAREEAERAAQQAEEAPTEETEAVEDAVEEAVEETETVEAAVEEIIADEPAVIAEPVEEETEEAPAEEIEAEEAPFVLPEEIDIDVMERPIPTEAEAELVSAEPEEVPEIPVAPHDADNIEAFAAGIAEELERAEELPALEIPDVPVEKTVEEEAEAVEETVEEEAEAVEETVEEEIEAVEEAVEEEAETVEEVVEEETEAVEEAVEEETEAVVEAVEEETEAVEEAVEEETEAVEETVEEETEAIEETVEEEAEVAEEAVEEEAETVEETVEEEAEAVEETVEEETEAGEEAVEEEAEAIEEAVEEETETVEEGVEEEIEETEGSAEEAKDASRPGHITGDDLTPFVLPAAVRIDIPGEESVESETLLMQPPVMEEEEEEFFDDLPEEEFYAEEEEEFYADEPAEGDVFIPELDELFEGEDAEDLPEEEDAEAESEDEEPEALDEEAEAPYAYDIEVLVADDVSPQEATQIVEDYERARGIDVDERWEEAERNWNIPEPVRMEQKEEVSPEKAAFILEQAAAIADELSDDETFDLTEDPNSDDDAFAAGSHALYNRIRIVQIPEEPEPEPVQSLAPEKIDLDLETVPDVQTLLEENAAAAAAFEQAAAAVVLDEKRYTPDPDALERESFAAIPEEETLIDELPSELLEKVFGHTEAPAAETELEAELLDEIPSETASLLAEELAEAEEETVIDELPEEEEIVIDELPEEEEIVIDELPEEEETVIDELPEEEEILIDELPEEEEVVTDELPEEEETVIDELPEEEEIVIEELPEEETDEYSEDEEDSDAFFTEDDEEEIDIEDLIAEKAAETEEDDLLDPETTRRLAKMDEAAEKEDRELNDLADSIRETQRQIEEEIARITRRFASISPQADEEETRAIFGRTGLDEPIPAPVEDEEPEIEEEEPITEPEPVIEEEPIVAPEPEIEEEEPEIIVEIEEPVEEEEPTIEPEPLIEEEPIVAPEPVIEEEEPELIVEIDEPVVEEEPEIIVEIEEPVVEEEPEIIVEIDGSAEEEEPEIIAEIDESAEEEEPEIVVEILPDEEDEPLFPEPDDVFIPELDGEFLPAQKAEKAPVIEAVEEVEEIEEIEAEEDDDAAESMFGAFDDGDFEDSFDDFDEDETFDEPQEDFPIEDANDADEPFDDVYIAELDDVFFGDIPEEEFAEEPEEPVIDPVRVKEQQRLENEIAEQERLIEESRQNRMALDRLAAELDRTILRDTAQAAAAAREQVEREKIERTAKIPVIDEDDDLPPAPEAPLYEEPAAVLHRTVQKNARHRSRKWRR